MTQLSYKNLLVSSFCAISISVVFSSVQAEEKVLTEQEQAQEQAAKAEIKCWTDQDGTTTCGNVVPSENSQQGFQGFSSEGQHIGDVGKAQTAEEIAAEQKLAELERKKEEERKKRKIVEDKLLELYSSEEDIETARKDSIDTIRIAIELNQSYIDRMRKNLADLESSLEASNNPEIHKMSAEERASTEHSIAETKQRILDYEETIQKKQLEIETANKQYDENLIMFKEVMKRRELGIE